MIPWKRQLHQAIENDIPILLDLKFDPGWEDLRYQFEGKASIQKPTRAAQKLLDHRHVLLPFENTAKFLKMAEFIHQVDSEALSNTYILYENDVRSYDDFVIGRDQQKLFQLQEQFHLAVTAISYLSAPHRREFLLGIEEDKEKRASPFPVLTFLSPSAATREKRIKDDSLRHDRGMVQQMRTNQDGVFVTLQSLDPRGVSDYAKRIIRNSNELAVIAVPYVHRDEFQEALDAHGKEKDETTQFGLMIMKLSRGSYQLCSKIPECLDPS